VFKAHVSHSTEEYTNIDFYGHELTLKTLQKLGDLDCFHFGINLSSREFDEFVRCLLMNNELRKYIFDGPRIVDEGTSMERKKVYLKCPDAFEYTIEVKGYPKL
jgi:extradiol dioxygenase family protein